MLRWFLTALVLLLLTSGLYTLSGLSLTTLGPAGAVIAFLSALSAGLTIRGENRSGGALCAALTTLLLIALLLLAAFLAGAGLRASAMIQTTVVTLAGVFLGLLFPGRRKRKRKLRKRR